MSERVEGKAARRGSRFWVSIVLFVLAGILLVSSIAGYVLRGSASTRENLGRMRTSAVLHAATAGLVDNIAQTARADKLKELRADKNFRKRGLDEVNRICDEAMEEARAEAEKLYSNPEVRDQAALESAIEAMEGLLATSGKLENQEKAVYADIYMQLVDNISNWREVAAEDMSDDAIIEALAKTAPALKSDGNAHLRPGFVKLARDMAAAQLAREETELQGQLESMMTGAIADWTEYSGLEGDDLWNKLAEELPELSGNERFRDALLETAATHIAAAENGETVPEAAAAEEGAETVSETQADYGYFIPTAELAKELEDNEAAFQTLNGQLVSIIPDLGGLSGKLQDTLRANLQKVLWPGSLEFTERYNAYSAQHAGDVLSGGAGNALKLASRAEALLLAAVALLLLGLVLVFWESLTRRFGVPRTIIALFFIYLCLLAEL